MPRSRSRTWGMDTSTGTGTGECSSSGSGGSGAKPLRWRRMKSAREAIELRGHVVDGS